MFDLELHWRLTERSSVKSEAVVRSVSFFNDWPRTKIRKQLVGRSSRHGRSLSPLGKSHAPVVLFLKDRSVVTIRLILNFGVQMDIAKVQIIATVCACSTSLSWISVRE